MVCANRVRLAGLSLVLAIAWVFASAPSSSDARARRQDPGDDDEAAFARFEAKTTFQQNCMICHSEDLTSSQRLTEKQWKSTVDKMIGWGSPVPQERVAPLIRFLANEYPPTKPREPAARGSLRQLVGELKHSSLGPADANSGAKVYLSQCANCHGGDGQGAELGPNLIEKQILLEKDEFERVVMEGRRRMPGYAAVLSRQQSDDILAWLRTRRYTPRRP
jgi:mono/diheme cytochrome c family protein